MDHVAASDLGRHAPAPVVAAPHHPPPVLGDPQPPLSAFEWNPVELFCLDVCVCPALFAMFHSISISVIQKVTLEGTHPHQWSPPRIHEVYTGDWTKLGGLKCNKRRWEIFILHNGDFDAWEVGGTSFDLGVIQAWLARATYSPMPCTVDSCAIAGVMDLLRAQGSWFHAVRLAYLVNGGLGNADNGLEAMHIPTMSEFELLARRMEKAMDEEVQSLLKANHWAAIDGGWNSEKEGGVELPPPMQNFKQHHGSNPVLLAKSKHMSAGMQMLRSGLCAKLGSVCSAQVREWSGQTSISKQDGAFATACVNNFFDNDLLQATRSFLSGATGSFGLCVNSSLDAHRQVCLAARGQTMSVAFYPKQGIVVWASEAAATKAPPAVIESSSSSSAVKENRGDVEGGLKQELDLDDLGPEPATRLDLDDLGGEICLLDWAKNPSVDGPPTVSMRAHSLQHETLMNGKVTITLAQESLAKFGQFQKRLIDLDTNQYITKLPPTVASPVAADILDIPRVCAAIQEEWQSPICMNRRTAYAFGKDINDRMIQHFDNKHVTGASDQRIDLLVTGCEASLWVGEQFAADLAEVMPRLVVKTVSANKVLGLFGQSQSLPATGFELSEHKWELTDCVVLIVSHSGGTFSPLAVGNLLQSATKKIYSINSEWDTQIGKQLRKIGTPVEGNMAMSDLKSRIFSTGVGMRPAEPCTVSVAATHQVLTQILIYLMGMVAEKDHTNHERYGATFTREECSQLQRMNEGTIDELELITGGDRVTGKALAGKKKPLTTVELEKVGNMWALHVLESPIIWVVCCVYVVTTVACGVSPLVRLALSAVGLCAGSLAKGGEEDDESLTLTYMIGVADAIVYIFLPQLATLVLRVLQGRPLLHRMVGRSVVIGDCPWVAQCAEAMASKLFACSYSNTGVAFYSGNPSDHLVHRFTHRVVRGSLLACGRPDGRLCGLTSAEASTCLSVNQASSIQNLGATCESITIGHNPSKLSLSKDAIFLPSVSRPDFLCEKALKELDPNYNGRGVSANALLGSYENLWAASEKLVEEKAAWAAKKEGRSLGDINPHKSYGASFLRQSSLQNQSSLKQDAKEEEEEEEEEEWGAEVRQSSLQNQSSLKQDAKEEEEEEEWGAEGTSTKKEEESALIPPPKIPGNVEASRETYFGEAMMASLQAQKDGGGSFNSSRSSSSKIPALLNLAESHDTACHEVLDHQRMVMRMYENRFASLQRLVSFFVLFHAMGKRVRDFWTNASFGLLGYEIDRTHSIMRIATTASPVSGAAIRDEMLNMALQKQFIRARMMLSSLIKIARLNGKFSRGIRGSAHSSNTLAALQSKPPTPKSGTGSTI
eukprot:CAMPEP_0171988882 /NCGR_PEP_ID=MMETSP0993-20121228/276127_1 /TAXON_ID=483369 /ORGANISM="non described non described, Strain CCMP2098" /LENGTH=1339 /DNA_ID=CAMNT_0012641859 /DNA_START=956 /DNA_END=4976 /DNA_ORIENTATION=-